MNQFIILYSRRELLNIALRARPLLGYWVPQRHLPFGVGLGEAWVDGVESITEQRVVHRRLLPVRTDDVELLERDYFCRGNRRANQDH